MSRFSLPRKASTPLDFEGEIIAWVTSREPDKDRWTELYIYRLCCDVCRPDHTEGWIVRTVGRSNVAGESDLSDAVACVLPEDVARALMKSDSSSGARRYYMPTIGLRLLVEAIDADPRLAVLDEAVEDLV